MKDKDVIAKLVKKHLARITKERDALRELISDAEDVAGHCDEAIQSLEHAVEILSQNL